MVSVKLPLRQTAEDPYNWALKPVNFSSSISQYPDWEHLFPKMGKDLLILVFRNTHSLTNKVNISHVLRLALSGRSYARKGLGGQGWPHLLLLLGWDTHTANQLLFALQHWRASCPWEGCWGSDGACQTLRAQFKGALGEAGEVPLFHQLTSDKSYTDRKAGWPPSDPYAEKHWVILESVSCCTETHGETSSWLVCIQQPALEGKQD